MMRRAVPFIAVAALTLMLTVPQGVALAEGVPSFTVFVDLDPQHVVGFFWTPGSTVTLEVDNGADSTIDFTAETTVDANGDAGFREGGFHVTEGDLVRLSDDLTPQNVAWTLVDYLTLSVVDAAEDVLGGDARTGTEVFVHACPPFPCTYLGEATTDTAGHWQVDLESVYDLVPGAQGIAQTNDPDGVPPYANHTQVKWRVPKPVAFWVSMDFNGIAGEGWLAGVNLTVTADDPKTATTPDITVVLPSEADGGFHGDQVLPGLAPGWFITVTDGLATKTHTVRDIAITGVDPTTEIMRGTAEPFTEVRASEDHDAASYWVTADGTGQWSANFSGDYDITPGTRMRALQMDGDGDHTFTDWVVPRPTGWQLNPVTGHYYLFVGDGKTWADAEEYAVSLGDHLVTINDSAEDAWLVATLGTQYWIGLNDIAVEGEWVWSSGERATYTNWLPGEPNNTDGTEDAAKIENWPPVGWNDLTPGAADPDAFVVEHAPIAQTITFAALSNRKISESPFTVSATASSGLPVMFTSNTRAVCRTSGDNGQTITLVGIGTCTLKADQPGNFSYGPAPTVSRSFTVYGLSQTITFRALSNRKISESPFTVSATASSGLPVTFTSNTRAVCRTSGHNGQTITLVGIGTCTLKADQAGNSVYSPAPSVSRSFTVTYCTGANCPPCTGNNCPSPPPCTGNNCPPPCTGNNCPPPTPCTGHCPPPP